MLPEVWSVWIIPIGVGLAFAVGLVVFVAAAVSHFREPDPPERWES